MNKPVVIIRQPNRTPIHLAVFAPIELGRECDGLLLADGQVSRRHLKLETVDGRVIATDLGSTNGSMLDEKQIASPVALLAGSVLRLGETSVELVVDTVARQRETLQESNPVDIRATTVAGATGAVKPSMSLPDGARATSIERVAESVVSERFDVSSIVSDAGTVTIVFSDIESSTEQNVKLGDSVWFEVLGRHNATVRKYLKQYGGTEIKNQGDGFMLSFPGARIAIQCMIAVQQELEAAREVDPERSVRIRVGLHTGEALADDDGDLFGQHVVVSARIANLALGGEVLVSSLLRDIVAPRGDVVFGDPRVVELKGMGDNPYTVYPIDWTQQLGQ
ncbi:MAG: adenylate/guanylate cyclase domain-containing protein [Acidimicrobiales bacterium]